MALRQGRGGSGYGGRDRGELLHTRVRGQLLEAIGSSVIRFGDFSPLLPHFKSLWQFFMSII